MNIETIIEHKLYAEINHTESMFEILKTEARIKKEVMDNFERVYRINKWAFNRYREKNRIVLSIGGKKSRYQWIVDTAIDKYLLNK